VAPVPVASGSGAGAIVFYASDCGVSFVLNVAAITSDPWPRFTCRRAGWGAFSIAGALAYVNWIDGEAAGAGDASFVRSHTQLGLIGAALLFASFARLDAGWHFRAGGLWRPAIARCCSSAPRSAKLGQRYVLARSGPGLCGLSVIPLYLWHWPLWSASLVQWPALLTRNDGGRSGRRGSHLPF